MNREGRGEGEDDLQKRAPTPPPLTFLSFSHKPIMSSAAPKARAGPKSSAAAAAAAAAAPGAVAGKRKREAAEEEVRRKTRENAASPQNRPPLSKPVPRLPRARSHGAS